MRRFFRWLGVRRGQGVADVLKRSFSTVRSFLPFHQDSALSEAEKIRRLGTDSAIRMVLSDDNGDLIESKLEVFRQLIHGERSSDEVDKQIQALRKVSPQTVETIASAISSFKEDERGKLMRFLLLLAAAAETPEKRIAELRQIFLSAGENEKSFSECRSETLRIDERRRRIIGSGAGILVALVVILVFILTAFLLRSVIFGLILAYILLPIEKYFERRERKKSGLVYYLFWLLSLPLLPLQKLSQRISRHRLSAPEEEITEEMKRRQERRIITKAVVQTALVMLAIICGVSVALTRLTIHYVGDFRDSAKISAAASSASEPQNGSGDAQPTGSSYVDGMIGSDKQADEAAKAKEDAKDQSAVEEGFSNLVGWLDGRLSGFRSNLERTPLIRFVLDQILEILRSEKAQKELLAMILKHSGGVISSTTGFLGSIMVFLSDLLLTVFFAMLFLVKLAEFCREDNSAGRQSEYLVRIVFNGQWLPGTNEVTIGEAKRILSGIMDRLRIWVRGYVTLVMVDATVYTVVFFFLRVPYFPILGIIAGCGILLPYVGPVISAALTLLVTLAVGNSSGLQLAGIVVAYLIYNGIIEQFILYPAVIGDSLGLTTLETIVVVLLGAVFAGIPGMLLALPTASVLKYLISQILQYLRMRKAAHEDAAMAEDEPSAAAPPSEPGQR